MTGLIARNPNKMLCPPEFEENLRKDLCPPCGKPKAEWTRRKDWRCCSMECTSAWMKAVTYGWQIFRSRYLKKHGRKCMKCGTEENKVTRKSKRIKDIEAYWKGGPMEVEEYEQTYTLDFEVDHIVPIALGGAEYDEANLQVLCTNCHKGKTRLDQGMIAKARKLLVTA